MEHYYLNYIILASTITSSIIITTLDILLAIINHNSNTQAIINKFTINLIMDVLFTFTVVIMLATNAIWDANLVQIVLQMTTHSSNKHKGNWIWIANPWEYLQFS